MASQDPQGTTHGGPGKSTAPATSQNAALPVNFIALTFP